MKKFIITLVLFLAVCLIFSMNVPTKILGAILAIGTIYCCALQDEESTKSTNTEY